jgi:hypothetical protein
LINEAVFALKGLGHTVRRRSNSLIRYTRTEWVMMIILL